MRVTIGALAGFFMLFALIVGDATAQSGTLETASVTQVDAGNADWVLSASNALDARATVEIYLARREGQWKGAFASAPRWNQASHSVETNELAWADGRLKGMIVVSFRSDGWVPAGKPPTARWVLDAGRDGNTIDGTFAGEVDGKASAGNLTGKMVPPSGSLSGQRMRVRLVDSTKLSEIFWCTVENNKPVGGYLFRGAWDGPVDLSRVDLRGCALTGDVSAVASDGRDLGSFGVRAFAIAGRVGGTFARPGAGLDGALAGTCVPLNKSQIAPYDPASVLVTGVSTVLVARTPALDLPDRWKKVQVAQRPELPPGLDKVLMPQGYDPVRDKDRRYPVLFHNGMSGANAPLWEAARKGKVRPMIYCTIKLKGDGFDGGLDRIIAYLDEYYPTIRDPKARFAMGFSAGAHHIFRYTDRTELVSSFAFFGHPLQASGWAHQKAAEREALIRGAEAHKKWPLNILLVAGTGEGGLVGIEPTSRVLESYGVKAKTIVIEGLRHDHAGHFEQKGDEIWGWVESCMGTPAPDSIAAEQERR